MKHLSLLLILIAAVSCRNAHVEKEIVKGQKSLKTVVLSEEVLDEESSKLVGMKCYLESPEDDSKPKEILIIDSSNKAETLSHKFYSIIEGTNSVENLKFKGTLISEVEYKDAAGSETTYLINANEIKVGDKETLEIEYDLSSGEFVLVRLTIDFEGNKSDKISFINGCEQGYEYTLSK